MGSQEQGGFENSGTGQLGVRPETPPFSPRGGIHARLQQLAPSTAGTLSQLMQLCISQPLGVVSKSRFGNMFFL